MSIIDYINVDDFGAIKGDIVDNKTIFEKISDIVNQNLNIKEVRFGAGTYKYSGGLYLLRGVKIVGNNTKLNYVGVGIAMELGDRLSLSVQEDQANFYLENFTIMGANNATSGIRVNKYYQDPTLNKIQFKNFGNSDKGYCIEFMGDNDVCTVSNCTSVSTTTNSFIYTTSDRNRLTVVGCNIVIGEPDNTHTACVAIYNNSPDTTIKDCTISGYNYMLELTTVGDRLYMENCVIRSGVKDTIIKCVLPVAKSGEEVVNNVIDSMVLNDISIDISDNNIKYIIKPENETIGFKSCSMNTINVMNGTNVTMVVKQNDVPGQEFNTARLVTGVNKFTNTEDSTNENILDWTKQSSGGGGTGSGYTFIPKVNKDTGILSWETEVDNPYPVPEPIKITGENGSTWWGVSTVNNNVPPHGADKGDFVLNTTNGDIYSVKSNILMELVLNINGEDGADGLRGTQIYYSASTPPNANNGSVGDFYLHGTVLYRKTDSVTWTLIADLKANNGTTFTPSVNTTTGVISWTNDGGLSNPPSVNIKGPKGDTGAAGTNGSNGKDGNNGSPWLSSNKDPVASDVTASTIVGTMWLNNRTYDLFQYQSGSTYTKIGNIKGRDGSIAELVPATTTALGGIIVGDNLNINDTGKLSVDVAGLNIPSAYTLPTATAQIKGGIKVGANLSITNDVLSVNVPSLNIPSAYTLPQASTTVLGGIKVGSNLSIADGVLSVNVPSLNIPTSYTLPTATAEIKGGVKLGTNLKIVDDKLSVDVPSLNIPTAYTLPQASTTVLGGVKTGQQIKIDEFGMLYINPDELPKVATSEKAGLVKIGASVKIVEGVITINNLTGNGAPTVKPDFIGQEYIDTTAKKLYKAFGLTVDDWVTEKVNLSGIVAPASAPEFIGQEYIDTVTKKLYKAFGLTVDDWIVIHEPAPVTP